MKAVVGVALLAFVMFPTRLLHTGAQAIFKKEAHLHFDL
jgi:hypothetical protein